MTKKIQTAHTLIGRFSTCSSNRTAYRFIEKYCGLSPLAARCDLRKITLLSSCTKIGCNWLYIPY